MKQLYVCIIIAVMTLGLISIPTQNCTAGEIIRPQEIKSMRQVIYDKETYVKLADLWKKYFDAYPSEYAYANWMYASRYAGDEKYWDKLNEGLKKYPANPTLLYLKSMEFRGVENDDEGRKFLERAVAIDPDYTDPWFSLVTHYMEAGDKERLEMAYRNLLSKGVITDDIMDYNYNMLLSMDKNGILITNGDNDTYPGWILTTLLKVRPDIKIVNRSLLNTTWYPLYIIEQGLPRFINKGELEKLRDSIKDNMKSDKGRINTSGLFGDTLILMLIKSAERAGLPVYFSKTLYIGDQLKESVEKGRDLGLVILVTPSSDSYKDQLRKVYSVWIDQFRTGGLDGWRLHHADATDAGRFLVPNYAAGIAANLENIKKDTPELRTGLFHWYINHIEELLSEEFRGKFAQVWNRYASDIKEIKNWCKKQGLE